MVIIYVHNKNKEWHKGFKVKTKKHEITRATLMDGEHKTCDVMCEQMGSICWEPTTSLLLCKDSDFAM